MPRTHDRKHRAVPGYGRPTLTESELARLLAALDRPGLPRFAIRALPDQSQKKARHNAPQAVLTLAELLWHVSEMHRHPIEFDPTGQPTFTLSRLSQRSPSPTAHSRQPLPPRDASPESESEPEPDLPRARQGGRGRRPRGSSGAASRNHLGGARWGALPEPTPGPILAPVDPTAVRQAVESATEKVLGAPIVLDPGDADEECLSVETPVEFKRQVSEDPNWLRSLRPEMTADEVIESGEEEARARFLPSTSSS